MKRILSNWWVVATGAAVLASLALFLVTGLISGLLFLRWWLIALVWLAFAAAAGWREVRRRRAAKALAEAVEPRDAEADAVSAKMRAALQRVRAEGRETLYQLPWYAIIGPPGAGKTTLIQKSGLRLVTEEATAGVGGTRDCDWWFTDEAVLIDTAGRYTSQDSDGARDARGWNGFLSALRKARPLRPLNGVVVAIGLDELATVSAEGLDRHVVTIRARLAELTRTLGLELPVYVLFTKADLLHGFTEFFDDLTVEGRRSVVGYTLPLAGDRPNAADLAAGYDEVTQSLADRVPQRLQDEGDPSRRGAAVTFPARIADLRARAVRLLDGVFGAEAGARTGTVRLRGFYITSGVQQGTPVDRLLAASAVSLSRASHARSASPRAFFVNRLFKDVIVAEAGLAGGNRARLSRDRHLRIGSLAALGAVAAVLLLGWTWSLLANRAGQRRTAEEASAIAEMTRGLDPGDRVSTSAGLADVLDLLDRLRVGLPYGVAHAGDPPLGERWGLYRRDLADESARAYNDALQRYLLPRLVVASERSLIAAGTDPLAVYDPLKVYLMLGQRAGAARDDKFVLRWLGDDLVSHELPGGENEATRSRILMHARALLADTGRFGRQLTGPLLDAALVTRAQATVAAMSPAQRALALMRQQVQGEDWKMVGSALLPGEAAAFGNPQEVASATVPYLFTKQGFQKGFIPRVATVGHTLEADRWMLGDSSAAQGALDPLELAQLYATEYTRQWNAVLALPQPGNYATDPTALARLANASASPLKKLTDQVIANTRALAPAGRIKVAAPSLPGGALGKAAGAAGTRALSAESGASASIAAARYIEASFQGLSDYASGPTAPLTQLLAALGKYQLALAQASVPGGGSVPGADGGGGAAGQIAAASAELGVAAANAGAAVPALGSFVKKVATGSSAASETQRTSELRAAYGQRVAGDCQGVMGRGYPFGTGPDLQPADVSRVAGEMDGFARDQLGSLIDRTQPKWTWIAEPTVAAFSPQSARQFQHAAEVQAMMGGNLVMRLSAAPTNAQPVKLRVAGVPLDLAPGSAGERLSWSSGGSQVAEVAAPGDPAVKPQRQEGPWALFRLLDGAKRQMLAKGRYRFALSPATAIDVEVLGGPNPLASDGPFSLRCPASL